MDGAGPASPTAVVAGDAAFPYSVGRLLDKTCDVAMPAAGAQPSLHQAEELMSAQPTLLTERLRLRPLTRDDAGPIKALAVSPEVRQFSDPIPASYQLGQVEAWIGALGHRFTAGQEAAFAIELGETGAVAGVVNLVLNASHQRGELGYWLGRPYWGCGYATEAGQALLRYGFAQLHLHRIFANYIGRNVASGRVLEKVGAVRRLST